MVVSLNSRLESNKEEKKVGSAEDDGNPTPHLGPLGFNSPNIAQRHALPWLPMVVLWCDPA